MNGGIFMKKNVKLRNLVKAMVVVGLLLTMMVMSAFAYADGGLFLGGGSIDDYNAEYYEALKSKTGKVNPEVVVLCSAASSYDSAYSAYYEDITGSLSYKNLFEMYGFTTTWIPITIDNYQTEAYAQENIDIIANADVIFFNGGDQAKHARCLIENNGTDTPLLEAIRIANTNGAIIAGTSAGTAIQGEYTYGEGDAYGYLEANGLVWKNISDISFADPSDDYNGGYTYGFGFLTDIDACIDTHVDGRGRIGRLPVAMRDLNADFGIGVSENTGIYIKDGVGEVYGENGVYIINGYYANYSVATYFEADGFEVSSLTSGDSYDFNTSTVTSSKALITRTRYRKVYNSDEIVTGDEGFRVLERLVDAKPTTAVGYSYYRNPEFRFDFTKDVYTKGYKGDGKYTVDNVKMDITY